MVRFENVGLRYGLGPEILRDLSFQIPAHSFQFLTGPSGAGKTSLLRLLFLSLRPTRGLVNLFGHDVSLLDKDAIADLRKRIGIVLQDFRLLDHMTTYENVALPFRVMGRAESSGRLPGGEVIDRASGLLAQAGQGAPGGPPEIALDDMIAGLLDARFDVIERESGLLLRGERALMQGARTLLGRPTSCVGRDWELGALSGLLDECIEERMARVVVVTAAAGMGKSRLGAELVSCVRERDEEVAEHARMSKRRASARARRRPHPRRASALASPSAFPRLATDDRGARGCRGTRSAMAAEEGASDANG